MNYLDQLRQHDAEKKIRGVGVPTELTKPPSVSFDGGGYRPVGNFPSEKPPLRAYPITARQMREVVQAASTYLEEYRQALVLGRLHICANCQRYEFATELHDAGVCEAHGEVMPFVPFQCLDFNLGTRPAAPFYSARSALLLEQP